MDLILILVCCGVNGDFLIQIGCGQGAHTADDTDGFHGGTSFLFVKNTFCFQFLLYINRMMDSTVGTAKKI
jgi:hypothetical protein